ncbi:hypothetical protein AN191_18390, partial [Loktanella sp. 5RATIMAR09]|uniref:hypothetical protein n=1 Tax=Loktanella sp. 5RATIMAR09 TaxID=1225655 RepID=UPI00070761F6
VIGQPGNPVVDTETDVTGTESIGTDAAGAYYVIDGEANILITAANGSPVIEGAGGWTITQAVTLDDGAGTTTGYEVLFENTNGTFAVWTLDANGERTDGGLVDVKSAEVLFGIDLPGGLEAGVVEAEGDVTLSLNSFGDYVVTDNPGGDPLGLTIALGETASPFLDPNAASDTFVWTAVAAEENLVDAPDGYRVLWEGADASGTVTEYFVGVHNDTGLATSTEAITSVEAAELEFDYDIPDAFVFAVV